MPVATLPRLVLRSGWDDDSFIKPSFFERLSSTWNKGRTRVPSLRDLSPGPSFRTDDFLLKASLAYLDPSTANPQVQHLHSSPFTTLL